MATDTQAQQNALREQRADDLQAARKSTNAVGKAHDIAQAEALRSQIQTNARANNNPGTTGTQTPVGTAPAGTPNTPSTIATPPSATSILNDVVNSIPGLSLHDPSGVFASWITGQVNAMNQTNTSASEMLSTLTATINDPAASGDKQAQAVFDQLFPGYNQRIATTGNNGGGLGTYLLYSTQIQSMAATLNLPAGTLGLTEIGNLWGQDINTPEVSQRLTTDYANAAQAWNNIPGFQNAMKAQGMNSLGQLVGYYVNPTNTLNQINQQISAGQLGAEAGNTGFGPISAAQSGALSAFLTNSGASQLSTTDAEKAFKGQLGGDVTSGTSAAGLAAGGFESTAPGQSSTGTVSQDTLLAGVEGNVPAEQQIARAQQARTAGAKGGGGAATTASGASGLGFAQS